MQEREIHFIDKRDEEFHNNRERYLKTQIGLKRSFLMGLIPAGVVFALLLLVSILKIAAMIIGSRLMIAQAIVNAEMGSDDKTGLETSVPIDFMAFLLLIVLLTVAAYMFKNRKLNFALAASYLAGAAYGIYGMYTGSCSNYMGIIMLAYGCYGLWLQDYIRRIYKELDYLSLQDGYPDFINALNDPKSMANTSGLTAKRSEYLKRIRKSGEDNENPLPIASELGMSDEMEGLTLDTPLPKSNRKIDNMM